MTKAPRTHQHNAHLREIGQRIRWVRELHEISQSELARLCGTDQSKWSKYELGQRVPDLFELIRFCDRFEVTLDFVCRARLSGLPPALRRGLLEAHPELASAESD